MDRYQLFKRLYGRIKFPLVCLICFGLGIITCWSVLSHFNLKATRLFYYQAKQHPYEKNLSKESMAVLDSVTVEFRQIMYHLLADYMDTTLSVREVSSKIFSQVQAIDKYAEYRIPVEAKRSKENLLGVFGGIGLIVANKIYADSIKHVIVRDILDQNMPAYRAGIRKEDLIISVNGQKVFDYNTATDLIRGKAGTKVELEIWRESSKDTLRLTVVREVIVLPTVSDTVLMTKPPIGLIRISEFSSAMPVRLKATMVRLSGKGINKFIFNLRGNLGGNTGSFLRSAILFADESDTLLVRQARRDTLVYDYNLVHKLWGVKKINEIGRIKAVCLVDSNTASAAEFFVTFLRQKRGYTLVGETTRGKGVGQGPHDLWGGAVLWMTNARYLMGNKQQAVTKGGIKPDFFVLPDSTSKEDIQLEKAIEILQKGGGG